ncbi:MAG: SDR family oxidoreductase [Actinobacteria bacterium]|nr:SDR family oxidoreductase [Actinomycetota bacterium]
MTILESFSLKGKVALVTGGAGSYGHSITSALSEAGAITYLASRNVGNCQKLASKLAARGYNVKAASLDLADEKSIDALYERMINEQGRVDILVNNAVLRPMKGYDDSIEKFRLSMEINATAVFYMSRLFSQSMIERNGGSIINISSYMGLLGPDFTLYDGLDMDAPPDYFFHKGGLNQLTKYFGSKLGKYNIRVNSICPGGYETSEINEEFKSRYIKKTFLNRLANEDDIKGIVVFLASDASCYITGAIIPLDGGYIAK